MTNDVAKTAYLSFRGLVETLWAMCQFNTPTVVEFTKVEAADSPAVLVTGRCQIFLELSLHALEGNLCLPE
jgi:hypothetical protein